MAGISSERAQALPAIATGGGTGGLRVWRWGQKSGSGEQGALVGSWQRAVGSIQAVDKRQL